MQTQQQQPRNLRVVAERTFRLVQREQVGNDSQITGHKVVKVGEAVTVDRMLGLELLAAGKARLADEAPAGKK